MSQIAMKNRRLELHAILTRICPNVYYQPPESVKLKFPCIVYGRNAINQNYADNNPYLANVAYSLRYITKEADDDTVMEIALLPKCKHTQHYAKENLYHDAYTIYY